MVSRERIRPITTDVNKNNWSGSIGSPGANTSQGNWAWGAGAGKSPWGSTPGTIFPAQPGTNPWLPVSQPGAWWSVSDQGGDSGSNTNGTSTGWIYPVNAQVEYLSGTLNQWISWRVLSHNNDNTYNLDCKPLVPPSRIRWPGGAENKARVLDDVMLEESPWQASTPGTNATLNRKTQNRMMEVIPEIESFAEHPMKS